MNISDEKLYQLCKQYGQQALRWRRKFIGLLPEVNRRKLYEKKGCASIFEFAAKLAGLSAEQVRLALNLERRFEDKPTLRSLLVDGKVSLNKLTRVVSITTVDNEKELAEKATQLSKKALETLVRDERVFVRQNGLGKPLFEGEDLPGQTPLTEGESTKGRRVSDSLNFELSAVVIEQLNELHALGKNVNVLLVDLLKERKKRIEEQKEKLSEEATETDSRYMHVPVRKVLEEEFGQKCSIKWCMRPATEIHHSQRFSLAHMHDPKYLAPLCREHHSIAHAVDRKVQAYKRGPP